MKLVALLSLTAFATARAELLLEERFGSDPTIERAIVTGDRSRFVYSDGQLLAAFDLLQPHARLSWPLSRALTEDESFTAEFEFTLQNVDFDDFNLCQLSFGFINMQETGTRRTESPGDSWELLTVDYFPGAGFPSYTPTFIRQRPPGGGDPLNSAYLKFPSGSTSLIDDFGEIGNLPEAVQLRTTLHYAAETQTVTVSLADVDGGLAINSFGANPDEDESTIQLRLAERFPFQFDAFALLLWDHFQGGSAELIAHSLRVETQRRDLLREAFPDGLPMPAFADGELSLVYRRDLAKKGFVVSAEHSEDLQTWSPVSHTVISSGPGEELRRVAVGDGLLRLRVTPQ